MKTTLGISVKIVLDLLSNQNPFIQNYLLSINNTIIQHVWSLYRLCQIKKNHNYYKSVYLVVLKLHKTIQVGMTEKVLKYHSE